MTDFVRTGDIETAYDVTGAGPDLVLLHGLQGGRKMLRPLVELLAPHFRVVTYDQRDSGETTNPPEAYDLERLADDAAAFLHGIGLERANVFGTSFGGRLAQVLAIKHPGVVDRLVLGATWPMPQSMADVNPDGLARFSRIRAGLPGTAHEMAELFVPKAFLDSHPAARQALLSMPDPADRAARRGQAAQTAYGDAADIRAPTLLIAGELDQVVPTHLTTAMATTIRGARSVVLDGVGHAAALQAPERLVEAIRRFLL